MADRPICRYFHKTSPAAGAGTSVSRIANAQGCGKLLRTLEQMPLIARISAFFFFFFFFFSPPSHPTPQPILIPRQAYFYSDGYSNRDLRDLLRAASPRGRAAADSLPNANHNLEQASQVSSGHDAKSCRTVPPGRPHTPARGALAISRNSSLLTSSLSVEHERHPIVSQPRRVGYLPEARCA